MKRRNFVKTTLLTGAATTMSAATFGLTPGFSLDPKSGSKAPFRLIYNNDTTNTAGIISPWHEEGESFREEMLVASIEEVAGTGVDAYMLSPGMGWVPWWQSNVDPDYFEWWEKRTGLKIEDDDPAGYMKYVHAGGDMVQVLIDTCRKHGMAPFVSLRLNDVHHQERYRDKDFWSTVSCRLYCEHPEWHIDPKHYEKKGYYNKRGMDWSRPEVREYKLALLRELSVKYDLAGLELDFLRDDNLFREDGPSHEERINIITDFVRQVRESLDEGATGRKRYLCVRIPVDMKVHSRSGLDVERLAEAGVDMFNLGIWYDTTQCPGVTQVRRRLPESSLYLEMAHTTGWHPHFLKNQAYGTNGNPRTSDQQFYTTAHLAYQQGVDGLSLWNFVYYRMGHHMDVPVMEPPFHVLRKLTDKAYVARQYRSYMLGSTSYFRQIPCELGKGQDQHFEMQMSAEAPGGSGASTPGRLRVHVSEPFAADHRLAVRFNGRLLEPSPDTSRFHGNPFDLMISPGESYRRAWILPPDAIVNGTNEIELTLEAGAERQLIYMDAGVGSDTKKV
jgi:hypothetical protein